MGTLKQRIEVITTIEDGGVTLSTARLNWCETVEPGIYSPSKWAAETLTILETQTAPYLAKDGDEYRAARLRNQLADLRATLEDMRGIVDAIKAAGGVEAVEAEAGEGTDAQTAVESFNAGYMQQQQAKRDAFNAACGK
jgi:hypothetical protein